ncbi:MAG: AbrB/MazE/SpoVT family DNA-binding domain-containing protein [Dehalococcoidia bacterium]|nr:AbrB/MazE/SpoVT family DNA-binding domain-containing protein [Dehalococcoidia bacterium]
MPRITRKGQVTIPKKVREHLGLNPGSEVDFRMEGGAYILEKNLKSGVIARWAGFLRSKRTSDEIIEQLRGKAK